MEVDLTVIPASNTRLQKKITELSKEFGVSFKIISADQLRLLVGDMMRYSPPHSGSAGSTIKKQDGFRSINTDLNRLFMPVKSSSLNSAKRLRGPLAGFRLIADPTEGIWAVQESNYHRNASQSKVNGIHTLARNKVGRVKKPMRNSEIHGLTVIHKEHISTSAFNRQFREKKKHVLKLASSWLPSFYALGIIAKTTAKPRGVPLGAIEKVEGGRKGYLEGGMKKGDGKLTAVSAAGYGERKWQSMLPSLLAKRSTDIRKQLRKRMEGIAARFNGRTA
jgi:hypothetical protein